MFEATTIPDRLRQLASSDPDKEAYVFVDKNWTRTALTRHEVWSLSQKCATLLRRKGINPGDVVCNTLPNSPARLITQLGTIVSGAIAMNSQICLADGDDFIYSLNTGRVKAVITNPVETETLGIIRSVLDKKGRPGLPSLETILPFDFDNGPSKEIEISGGWVEETFNMNDVTKEVEGVEATVMPNDACAYMTTSGSTGYFKLVEFSHGNLLVYGSRFAESLEVSENDIYFNDRPFGWMGGYPLFPLVTGCTRVAVGFSKGLAESYMGFLKKVLKHEKCSVMYTVPYPMESLCNLVRTEGWEDYRLRVCGVGSGPVTSKHVIGGLDVLSQKVTVIFGCTEGGIVSSMPLTDAAEYKHLCVGKPLPDVEIKIVDANMIEVPNTVEGSVVFRTTQRANLYANDEENTSKAFLKDGWLNLGDIGFKDADGNLYLAGRSSFAILRGPRIIYPYALETRIKQCPGVQNVVIVGVPDPNLHEEVCACVVREPDVELSKSRLLEYCENLFVDSNNSETNPVPKHVMFVQSLPQTRIGKVDRVKVKEQACAFVEIKL